MKITIKESPQNIQVTRTSNLSKNQISNYMLMARRSKEYVKFILDKNYYIMVQFNRDGTVHLLSNIRFENEFQRQLYWLDKYGFDQGKWSHFIWFWLDRFSKKDLKFN